MEFICSMTGKSPSTTGAGSEGALTKGPFNALPPIIDLNNALVSYVLTGYDGLRHRRRLRRPEGPRGSRHQPAGAGGLVPHDAGGTRAEISDRRTVTSTSARTLNTTAKVLASRLGYRINARFVRAFFGRVFNHPHAVFTEEMLRPEMQDLEIFADGMDNIVATQKRVAQMYFNDGSIEQACPPLKALLQIMLARRWEGQGLDHPGFRKLFTRENVLASDWYADRLGARQTADIRLWDRHVRSLQEFRQGELCRRSGAPGYSRAFSSAPAASSRAGSICRLSGTVCAAPSAFSRCESSCQRRASAAEGRAPVRHALVNLSYQSKWVIKGKNGRSIDLPPVLL